MTNPKPFLFSLGRVVATPGILRALEAAHEVSSTFIIRHQQGDWSECSPGDKRANEQALKDGSRIFSVYHMSLDWLTLLTDFEAYPTRWHAAIEILGTTTTAFYTTIEPLFAIYNHITLRQAK